MYSSVTQSLNFIHLFIHSEIFIDCLFCAIQNFECLEIQQGAKQVSPLMSLRI